MAISAKSKQPKANTGFIKMDWITILGLIAATLTTGSFIPQAVKVVQTKSTKDLSLGMFVILTAGIVLWLAYGIFIDSLPVIAANAVSFFLAVTILAYKIKYK